MEFAHTIHESGADLLNLINDILDLSKIESGKVTVDIRDLAFSEIREHLNRTFQHMADAKGLEFRVDLAPGLPRGISTGADRLQQVLKNLLSNAFKFTNEGNVRLVIAGAADGWDPDNMNLSRAERVISFSVTDTGIGIPPDKQRIIFEAFQQADGSTSRKYGGTGLGLSISREIAHLLGGEVRLQSATGKGSTFILYLPLRYETPGGRRFSDPVDHREWASSWSQPPAPPRPKDRKSSAASPVDDRESIEPTDRVLLIVEDDLNFADILLGLAREKGFKGVIAQSGDTALALARHYKPDAVTLDIMLPDLDGWTVLDRLKLDPETRHIPVHIISVEEQRERGLQRGALSYLTKPVTKEALDAAFENLANFLNRPRRLLVVDGDENDCRRIVELIGNSDVLTTAVAGGEEALELLRKESFNCMVLDLKLPGMSGFELLTELQKLPDRVLMPVIIYTGKSLTAKEESLLAKVSLSVLIKGVSSPERLLDETALFLHRVAGRLPESKRRMLEELYVGDKALTDKTALVVDDDVRNIFALTSVLERHKMQVRYAENGRDALELLKKTPEIDVVLMDIMMPEMDGYETTRAIRKIAKFRKLPIIALTAKAMKGDREKCIEAGASDYITKPVDTEQLLSLLRVWLYR